MRKAGILLHISSLPSKYGIGTFGKEAYKFVDFLEQTGQTCWQILPLGPTSYGDSPYQTLSAFALNPYFIDLDFLVHEKLLKPDEINDSQTTEEKVDFGRIYTERFETLKKAYQHFDKTEENYLNFLDDYDFWLADYALFMAFKTSQNGIPWDKWPNDLRLRNIDAIENARTTLKDEIEYQYFMQYKAYQQWFDLKQYANQKGITIIGDMPIYVAFDSSDVWTKPQYFQLDENRYPILVAGVPPDKFSKDGQRWGNPLYRWDILESENFAWWIWRIKSNATLFDTIRIDHFIGFVNYFGIPFGDKTAKNGKWYDGPSYRFFDAVNWQLGNPSIIAEDLGIITDAVKDLLKHTGFPGIKVLQFAFDTKKPSDYLPHVYTRHVVAYTGTHDNETTTEWFSKLSPNQLKYVLEYINHGRGSKTDSFIKAALASVADTAIIPMQDYLSLGSEARLNTPSTLGNNWVWRLKPNQLDRVVRNKVKYFTKLYDRNKK